MRFKRAPLKTYGPVETLWLCLCKLITAIFFNGCRLVRLPIFLRGRRNIVFGEGFVCGYLTRLDAFGGPGCLSFGKNVQLNDFVHIGALESVVIGHNVLIASRVFITDHDHGVYGTSVHASAPDQAPTDRIEVSKPVRIGDNVWLGEGVCVLAGVSIGAGSVIGAGAVVTHDVPSGCIAAGVPAKVLRRYDEASRQWLAVPR
jgi:lipopolysaccharide O-acetyltransferase